MATLHALDVQKYVKSGQVLTSSTKRWVVSSPVSLAQAQVRAVHQALPDRQLRCVDVVLLHVAADAREALLILRETLRVFASALFQGLNSCIAKLPRP